MRSSVLSGSLLLLSAVSGLTARAGEAWDIERCIRHAVEHNIQVKQGLNTRNTGASPRSRCTMRI